MSRDQPYFKEVSGIVASSAADRLVIGRLSGEKTEQGSADLAGRYVFSLKGASEPFQVQVRSSADRRFPIALSCNNLEWSISCDPENCHILPRLLPSLLDSCVAGALASGELPVFLAVQDDGDFVWLATSSMSKQRGEITIKRLRSPQTVPTDFLLANARDQEGQIKESFQIFSQWCGPLLSDLDPPDRMLFVKLALGCRWMMCFPFSSYVRFNLGEFAAFTNVNWIVTDRSFSEVMFSWALLQKGLSSLANLLQGTVIVINRYLQHMKGACGPQVEEAVEVLRLLLSSVKDVQVDGRGYTLRWVVDPSARDLENLLLDPATRFVFADMEAGGGRWQLSDCDTSTGECVAKTPEFVALESFKNKLDHIQLLRIFHCNSAFRARSSLSVPGGGQQPADDTTIVRHLLATGAQTVEGGMTRESFFEFFHSVAQLILCTDLYHVLQSASLGDPRFDLAAAVGRCNSLLAAVGFDPIAVP
jgi:hypothetical protein